MRRKKHNQDLEYLFIEKETFMELLDELDTWKLSNDDYDMLSIHIRKNPNKYEYECELFWQPCGENNE